MAVTVLNNVGIILGSARISTVSNSCALSRGAEIKEKNCFEGTGGFRGKIGGLKTATVGISGYADNDVIDEELFAKMGGLGQVLSFQPNGFGIPGDVYGCPMMLAEWSPGAEIGEIMSFDLRAEASDGSLVRGKALTFQENRTTSFTGTPTVNLGALLAAQRVALWAHVWDFTGAGSITLAWQSSPNADGSAPVLQHQVVGINAAAKGSWWQELQGPIAGPYWRGDITVTGSVNVDVLMCVGIIQ